MPKEALSCTPTTTGRAGTAPFYLVPEAAELDTLRRQIEPFLPARIMAVSLWGERTVRAHDPSLVTDLSGESFVTVSRVGKWLFLHTVDSGVLTVHLRMSGRLHMTEPSSPMEKHTHASFTLQTPLGSRLLRFIDPRTFGEIRLARTVSDVVPSVPDVTSPLSLSSVPQTLLSSRRAIKAVLLEQTLLVQGVGNYMADEVCHRAGILPSRSAASLSVLDWQRVLSAIPVSFAATTALRGVALADESWRDLFGDLGQGQEALLVHARTFCGTCGGPVSKTSVASRSAYACHRCQS